MALDFVIFLCLLLYQMRQTTTKEHKHIKILDMKLSKTNKAELFETETGFYVEYINGDGFNISAEFTSLCYPQNHEYFNSVAAITELVIYDHDMIFDIEPHIKTLRSLFTNAKIIIV